MVMILPRYDVWWVVDPGFEIVCENEVLQPWGVHLVATGGEKTGVSGWGGVTSFFINRELQRAITPPHSPTFMICPRPGFRSGSGCSSPDLMPVQLMTTSAPDSASYAPMRGERCGWRRPEKVASNELGEGTLHTSDIISLFSASQKSNNVQHNNWLLSRTFIQGNLQLIRQSRGHSPWRNAGLRALLKPFYHGYGIWMCMWMHVCACIIFVHSSSLKP